MFTLAGYGGDKPALLAGGNYISYTASLALAIYLSDRFGRRKLMLTGCLSMGIVLIAGGILAREVTSKSASGQLALANQLGGGVATVLYLYTFIYGSTWLTTWYVLVKFRFHGSHFCITVKNFGARWTCQVSPNFRYPERFKHIDSYPAESLYYGAQCGTNI